MTLNTLDLFCGAGGFSLGFSRTGFRTVGAIDYESAALETFRLHHAAPAVAADLSRLMYDDGPTGGDLLSLLSLTPEDVDVVIGGPPCQGFSQAGNRDSDDPINDLVWTFFDVVAAAKPQAFVMENVSGLRKHKGGDTLAALVECGEGLGFSVKNRVLNAADYGVPQKRKRLFIIGVRDGVPTFPEPLEGPPVTVQEALSQLAGGGFPDGDRTDHLESTIEKISDLEHGESLYNKSHQVRLRPEEPAPTIKASNRRIHPFEDRELSIRESAVLQSFPPDYDFAGIERNRGARTRQVGNAVPPLLAEHISRALLDSLGESEATELPTDSVGMSMQELSNLSGRLTEREVEAVLLRSGGLSWREVGDEMDINHKTAANLSYRAEEKVETAKKTIEAFERLTRGDI